MALNKPERAEKEEKPKNRRIIKITTANICTDSAPNSNIMRTPPRSVDIFGRRNIRRGFATVGSHYTRVVNLIN
jgi:hypothetical protein